MSTPQAPTNSTRTSNNSTGRTANATASAVTSTTPPALTDSSVIQYLRQKGLTKAALELSQHLAVTQKKDSNQPSSRREQLERDEEKAKSSRTALTRATGGGLGYDVDSGVQVSQWGVPDSASPNAVEGMGVAEARAYVDAFVELQLWVLGLPEESGIIEFKDETKEEILSQLKKPNSISGIKTFAKERDSSKQTQESSVTTEKEDGARKMPAQKKPPSQQTVYAGTPSMKPELLSVTFALLVHTYCELLEVGMETTAQSILSTFSTFYLPDYEKELSDLNKCQSTEDIVRLNAYNSTHLDALACLKAIMVQVGHYQLRKEELQQSSSSSTSDYHSSSKRKLLLNELDHKISSSMQSYEEVAKGATMSYEKMQDLPFLRRARAVRWQITLSASSYSMLASMFSGSSRLLPMNTLLLKQCEIQIEYRDPLPKLPACVFSQSDNEGNLISSKSTESSEKRNDNKRRIDWAAPIAKEARRLESGEETTDAESVTRDLPFPPLYLNEEGYDTREEGNKSKQKVEFNRSLLQNGFRRLEAIERKLEYEVGLHKEISATAEKSDNNEIESPATAIDPQKPSILLSTLCASSSAGVAVWSRSSNSTSNSTLDAAASIWEESGIGISCAKLCPPDGRRIAAGCDDAAVRIWSIFPCSDEQDVRETSMVLLGHKNGFPVFDVHWNRDGRTLLSAGGDGSVRLWDTLVQGTFGHVAKNVGRNNISNKNSGNQNSSQQNKGKKNSSTTSGNGTNDINMKNNDISQPPEANFNDTVPGARSEPAPASGAALAVYRGHSPQCPVWSVAFSPSGYYFASAAADGTARLWVTDRPTPVRIFAGHTRASVNCVTWHPNANYILTGCDDQTARLWDIHSGQCVRLFRGCRAGISTAIISPSGRFAAAADYTGIVHVWDLGSGQKCHELRHNHSLMPQKQSLPQQVHALAYSSCGTTLAIGGDDCHVSIWDVRSSLSNQKQEHLPVRAFSTRRTVVMDLHYTKRNLLLSVGKYTTPIVPLVSD